MRMKRILVKLQNQPTQNLIELLVMTTVDVTEVQIDDSIEI